MTYSLDLDAGIDYKPRPPLDIDPRPIEGDQLRQWRHGLWRDMRQADMAQIFGLSQHRWSQMEIRGLTDASAGWCALIREWFAHRREPPERRATIQEVKAIANLVGGWPGLADALGKTASAVREWSNRGVPSRGGYGLMFAWLFDEFGLEPADEVRKRADHLRELSRLEVLELRTRFKNGETRAELAREKGVSWTCIDQAVRGKTWRWVG